MGQDHNQDTIMLDQETNEQASGKGKDIIVDSTLPSSPVRTIRDSGSPSSEIPPAVKVALDDMKAEISEMKADIKTEISEMKADMNATGQATNIKIDRMMEFLQELASRLPKP
ncbi:hypothetical protein QL285_009603 [Trifolium repens]|jgi:hypothetical protein|nr:hypothetical protein QL285_009603 [Trifolium repens]